MSRQLLIVSPTSREHRELPALAARLDCQLIFDDFAGTFFDDVLGKNDIKDASEMLPLIEETISRYKESGLSGVTSGVGYPGVPVAAIVAERLGLCGPRVDRVLLCEHKYYSRLAQRELVPDATPDFGLIDPLCPRLPRGMSFPLFVKPVKSCFSINARRVSDEDELRSLVAHGAMPEAFLKPFDELLSNYTDFELGSSFCLAESPLQGVQVSLEGYVFRGRVHTLGIVDAIMYPGTISFRRFQYPSSLDREVQRRMSRIAETLINGIGYDNACFNVELIHDPLTDEIHIVEVNPKIASQFTDLFEKVDGASSYYPLLQIALGEEPEFPKGLGPYKFAASCVLRTFEDKRVLRVPSDQKIAALKERFPDARVEVTVQEGRLLSDVMQDGKSFRYCVVNIGANSPAELEEKFESCKNALEFSFAPP